jgi:predicted amidophosphoribosyltransferase
MKQRQHNLGPEGECICPRCEARLPHRRGVRCQEEACPACGSRMLRIGSEDYELWRQRHKETTAG